MEAKPMVLVVFIWAVCHVTEAQLPMPTTLQTNITRAGCGSSKLCISSVSTCDPSGNSNCYFSSIQVNNQTMVIELSGITSGYVALGLAASNQSEGGAVVFVCGNNNINPTNGTFFFNTVTQNGTMLTSANVSTVYSVQGIIKQNQSLIQCTFNTSTNLNISNAKNVIISNTTTSYINILSGSSNGTNLGSAATVLNFSAPLNLTDSTLDLSPNLPPASSPIMLNITRNGCGTSKLCLSSPPVCDPAGSSCFFASSTMNNQSFSFELSGRTSGYVALGLSKQNYTYVFVCGNNNNNSSSSSSFFFQTATQNGTMLTPVNVSTVYNSQGQVTQNQSLIQCIFNTSTSFNISTKAVDSSYTVSIFNGTANGTQLGNAITQYISSVLLDLSKPNALANLTTQTTQTTQSPPANGSNLVFSLWTQMLAVLLTAASLHFIISHSP